MRRLLLALFVSGILGLGIAIGFGARTLSDQWQVQSEPTNAAGGLTTGPATAPPASTVGATTTSPPTAPPTATRLPTTVPQDVVVEVTEGELEGQLASLIVGQSIGTTPLGDATIQNVNVRLRDSQIHVGGGARAGFLQAPFDAAGTIVPDDAGKPVVQVSQANIGGIDLPESARAALAETLQERVDGLLDDRNMRIRTIHIADGKMRVVGRAGS